MSNPQSLTSFAAKTQPGTETALKFLHDAFLHKVKEKIRRDAEERASTAKRGRPALGLGRNAAASIRGLDVGDAALKVWEEASAAEKDNRRRKKRKEEQKAAAATAAKKKRRRRGRPSRDSSAEQC